MHKVAVDLGDACDGDTASLFNSKGMVGRFELDIRTNSAVAEMYSCLQILGTRIEWEHLRR